jgi:hypothetical protein
MKSSNGLAFELLSPASGGVFAKIDRLIKKL